MQYYLSKTIEGEFKKVIEKVTDLLSEEGFGIKYQLTGNLNLEASTTYFFTSMNGGAGSTYNLGVRFIL